MIKDLEIDPKEAELRDEDLKDIGGEVPDWYEAVAPKRKTGPKKRHPEVKLNDFVDSSKFIKGSSEDEESDDEDDDGNKKRRKVKKRGRKPGKKVDGSDAEMEE